MVAKQQESKASTEVGQKTTTQNKERNPTYSEVVAGADPNSKIIIKERPPIPPKPVLKQEGKPIIPPKPATLKEKPAIPPKPQKFKPLPPTPNKQLANQGEKKPLPPTPSTANKNNRPLADIKLEDHEKKEKPEQEATPSTNTNSPPVRPDIKKHIEDQKQKASTNKEYQQQMKFVDKAKEQATKNQKQTKPKSSTGVLDRAVQQTKSKNNTPKAATGLKPDSKQTKGRRFLKPKPYLK